MTLPSIGDRSQSFQNIRNGTRLKQSLDRLAQELSTGKPTDTARHLLGRTSGVAALTRGVAMIDAYLGSSRTLATTLDQQQLILTTVTNGAETLAQGLVGLHADATDQQMDLAERSGTEQFRMAVDQINFRMSGRSIFGGAATDRAPLADADTMLTAVESVVAGLTDPAAISAAIDAWFMDPAGGFATTAYAGATDSQARVQVAEKQSVEGPVRADVAEIRKMLSALAGPAISARISGSLTRAARADLLAGSGDRIFGAVTAVTSLQGRLGEQQARIEGASVRQTTERSVYAMALNDMTSLDKYDVATRLQDAQQSLELHFAATARLSQLTLANYL